MKGMPVLKAVALCVVATGGRLSMAAETPAERGVKVETWRVAEIAFESAKDYSQGGGDAVRFDVAFTNGADGAVVVRPGFWDGGKVFRVRFAPTAQGVWKWTSSCPDDAALNGKSGSVTATPYMGKLDVYRHGFVKVVPGKKHFAYADGTPFFYLGDTHWGMYKEEIDEAGPHAGGVKTDSHFKYIVNRRAEQGFTVYQSEPIGAKFNLADGRVDAADIPGFQLADRYYRHIADAGLVHANAEFFFSASMRRPLVDDKPALERLSRYWVARFGAYPVMWTLAQEIDNDFYHERGHQKEYSCTNNPWVAVAEFIHRYDAYKHPLSGHQENTSHTTVTGAGTTAGKGKISGGGASVFASKAVSARTGHNWWAAQWSPSLTGLASVAVAMDYWRSSRPAVNYEGRYCYLWTKDFGARAQGWISLLNGFCGYGYGAIDMWLYQSTYDVKKESNDGVEKITIADKAVHWSEAIEFPSAHHMGHMRRFFEGMDWWRLVPDIGKTPFFVPDGNVAYACASIGRSRYVLYFHDRKAVRTGSLRGTMEDVKYSARWFNPRTGVYGERFTLPDPVNGLRRLPPKPDLEDWALDVNVSLIASAPVLMNAAETSIGVAFAVTDCACGWVDVSELPDMSAARRVHAGSGCIMDVGDKFACIRIRDLKPATKYHYRIGADRIRFENNYKRVNLGPEMDEKVHSFTTLGAAAEGSFCVIQDTHSRPAIVDLAFTKIAELKPSVIIWNGDARNFYRTCDDAIGTFLKPHPKHLEYAAETPIMFLNGNHDFRGRFGLHLEELVMFREQDERHPRYASLGRNFVQRLGDIALIGLDTGEDKQDSNPIQGGITRMKEYRELQTRWLADVIEIPVVKTAKFKVAFCHIPLYEPNPRQNPGDVVPDDADPRYYHPWAAWQRTCAEMWGPLFEKAGVQLVCTGHQHVFRYNPPEPGRSWAHMIGGGPDFIPGKSRSYPTVIEGRVVDGKLVVTVHDAGNRRIVFENKWSE